MSLFSPPCSEHQHHITQLGLALDALHFDRKGSERVKVSPNVVVTACSETRPRVFRQKTACNDFLHYKAIDKASTCVDRGTRDTNNILSILIAFLNGSSDVITISGHDRLSILDFPDTATQAANVAALTSLSKAELLERANPSPSALDDKIINLFKQLFCLT